MTAGVWDVFADEILTAPAICNLTPMDSEEGCSLLNICKFDNQLKWDVEELEECINKYGLYSYDDFQDIIPKAVFDMFNIKYFKILNGKGIIDKDLFFEKLKDIF